jgi:hypothetical protein
MTLAVGLGKKHSHRLVFLLLVSGFALGCLTFQWQALLPIVFLAFAAASFNNGYYLHQLSILICAFTYLGIYLSLTSGSVWLMDLLCAGTVLNFVFYPLLSRRSNPTYVGESRLGQTIW